LQIIALASISLRGERSGKKERDVLLELIDKMRCLPHMKHVPMVFIPECMMANCASQLSEHVRRKYRVCIMSEKPGGGEGVPKTNEIGDRLRDRFESILVEGRLRFSTAMATLEHGVQDEQRQLISQMENLRYEQLPKHNNYDPTRWKLTGKPKDDVMIACLMCPLWGIFFRSSTAAKYARFRDLIRQRDNDYFPTTMMGA